MSSKIKWKIEYEKGVICQNFDRRGWTRTEDNDWNIFWASVQTVKQLFNPDSGWRAGEGQYVCHFPNHHELTRKDLMVKNIKRFSKDLQKEGKTMQEVRRILTL